MKEILDRIEAKVDKLDDRLDLVDITLVKQEANLKEHMRRTHLLEGKVEHIETEIQKELEPVKKHVNQVKIVAKIIGIIIPAIATIIIAYWK